MFSNERWPTIWLRVFFLTFLHQTAQEYIYSKRELVMSGYKYPGTQQEHRDAEGRRPHALALLPFFRGTSAAGMLVTPKRLILWIFEIKSSK